MRKSQGVSGNKSITLRVTQFAFDNLYKLAQSWIQLQTDKTLYNSHIVIPIPRTMVEPSSTKSGVSSNSSEL